MAWVIFDHRVKYRGAFYPANQRFLVEEGDLPSLLEAGGREQEVKAGRPRKQPAPELSV